MPTIFLASLLGLASACGLGADRPTLAKACSAAAKELAAISSCRVASDCGQILEGVSCGCTRAPVVRLKADAKPYLKLRAEAAKLLETWSDMPPKECSTFPVSGISPCDCPPADGFACIEQRSVWNFPTP